MNFERTGKYKSESSEGYIVAAVKSGDDWVFVASGPKRATVFHRNGDITTGDVQHRISYAIGEATPSQRDHLGAYRSSDFNDTEAARIAAQDACRSHLARVLPTSLPHGHAAPREISSREEVLRGLCDAG